MPSSSNDAGDFVFLADKLMLGPDVLGSPVFLSNVDSQEGQRCGILDSEWLLFLLVRGAGGLKTPVTRGKVQIRTGVCSEVCMYVCICTASCNMYLSGFLIG